MATPPVSGPVTSGWGERALGFHRGIDFGVPVGTPVVANRAGTVVRADYDLTGFGWHVRVQSGPLLLIYGHLSSLAVKVGQQVAQGARLGLSGNSGTSTGPHLHFEVRKGGTGIGAAVNPTPYLSGDGPGTSSGGAGFLPIVGGIISGGLGLGALPGVQAGKGDVGGAIESTGDAVIGGARGVLGGIEAIGAFFGALGQRNTWVRVIQVVGGGALVVGGVVIVGRGVIGEVAVAAVPGGPAVKAAVSGAK